MSRRLYGPFNRVEGDLEVQVEVEDGRIKAAWVNSPLFRGFEQILHGRDPRDALVYTPRICGICSVSQSVAAASALREAMGLEMPDNGRLAANLVLACENLADHLTHFYLFFMPDFAREAYADQPWHPAIAERFRAQTGRCAGEVLPARAAFLHLTGILAGKWPHSLSLQPGGSTRPVQVQERIRLRRIVGQFRQFLETTLFGDTLEAVAALDSPGALDDWAERHADSDFGRFLQVAGALDLAAIGRGPDRFLSFGAYPQADGHLFTRGTWAEGERGELDSTAIREDVSYSWMQPQNGPRHPREGATLPAADKPGAYSWCKAPRLDGQVMETGALARQLIDDHPLIRTLVAQSGGNVRNRMVARLLELARLVPVMEDWVLALRPREPFCLNAPVPDEAEGAGLVEAARGSLGHWLRVRNGRILNYQIIAPTTWNFSPRDTDGT
ncbi:MAG TPA: HupV protein, partial [Chromatiaceae bacterium]|nr:HupV protein [Chromatiaceae bacterium]